MEIRTTPSANHGSDADQEGVVAVPSRSVTFLTQRASDADARGTGSIIDQVVGHNLAAKRREAGLSERTLAEGLKVSVEQLQRLESGEQRIAATNLMDAAGILGVPLASFFTGEN